MLTDSPSASTDSSADAARRLVRFANRCNVIPSIPHAPGRQRSQSRTRMVVRRDTTLWSVRVPTIGFISTPTIPHPDSPELHSALKHHGPHIPCHCESTPIAELLPAVDPPSPTPRTPHTIPEDPSASPDPNSSPRPTLGFLQRIGLQHSTPPPSTPPPGAHAADEWDEGCGGGDMLLPLRNCCLECFSATEHPARAIRWTARAFRAWKEYSGPQDVKKREAEEEERKARLRMGARDLSPQPRPLSLQLNVDEIDVLKKRRLHSLEEQDAMLLDETDPHSTFSAMGSADLPHSSVAPEESPVSPATDYSASPLTGSTLPDVRAFGDRALLGATSFDGEFPLPRRSARSSAATSPAGSASASKVSLAKETIVKEAAPALKESALSSKTKDTLAVPLSLPLVGKSSRTSLLRNASRTSLRKSSSRPGSSASLARQLRPNSLSAETARAVDLVDSDASVAVSPASVAENVAAALAKTTGNSTRRWSLGPEAEGQLPDEECQSESGSCSSDSEDDVFHDVSEEALGVYDDNEAGENKTVAGEDGMLGASISRRAAQVDAAKIAPSAIRSESGAGKTALGVARPAKRPSPPVVAERPSRPASAAGSAKGLPSALRPASRASSFKLSVEMSRPASDAEGAVTVLSEGDDKVLSEGAVKVAADGSVTADAPSRPSTSSQLRPYTVTASRPLSSSRPASSHGSRPPSSHGGAARPTSTASRPMSSASRHERGRPASRGGEMRADSWRGSRMSEDGGARGRRSISGASTERAPSRVPPSALPDARAASDSPASAAMGRSSPKDQHTRAGGTSSMPGTPPADAVPPTPAPPPLALQTSLHVPQTPKMAHKVSKGTMDDGWVALSADDAASIADDADPWLGSPGSRPDSPIMRMMRSLSRGPKRRRAVPKTHAGEAKDTGSKDSVTASGSSTSSNEALGGHPLNQGAVGHNLLHMIRSRSRSRGPVSREGSASDLSELQSNASTGFFGLVRTKSRGGTPRSNRATPKRAHTMGMPVLGSASPSPGPSDADPRRQDSPPPLRTKGRPGPASVVPSTLARASTERRASLQASPSSPTPRRSRAASTGSVMRPQDATAPNGTDGQRLPDDVEIAPDSGRRPGPQPAQTKQAASRRTTSFSAASARSFLSNVNFAGMLRGVSVGMGGGSGT